MVAPDAPAESMMGWINLTGGRSAVTVISPEPSEFTKSYDPRNHEYEQ
jgi:hypothetical protein